jgi:general stress protein YciG
MKKNSTSSQQLPVTPTKDAAATTRRPAARVGDGIARRGFASMDPALQHRLAAAGGKASHASGRGHQWTIEEAREAGRKGGRISRRKPSNPTPGK